MIEGLPLISSVLFPFLAVSINAGSPNLSVHTSGLGFREAGPSILNFGKPLCSVPVFGVAGSFKLPNPVYGCLWCPLKEIECGISPNHDESPIYPTFYLLRVTVVVSVLHATGGNWKLISLYKKNCDRVIHLL